MTCPRCKAVDSPRGYDMKTGLCWFCVFLPPRLAPTASDVPTLNGGTDAQRASVGAS